MRRIVLRSLAGLLALVLVALIGGYWYERPLLMTGTGYAAHNACALKAIAGRDDATSDLPPNPLVPYLRSSVDADGTTRSTILGVLAGQTAYATKGFGCTLDHGRPNHGTATPVAATGNPFTDAPAPAVDATLDPLLAKAFGDDLDAAAKKALGTRAVLVVRDGKLVAERYSDGFTKSTPQLGWSMSKSVASLLTGRLVQEGKVALTDKVNGADDWQKDGRAAITVEQLLRMTSGLSWDETYDLGTPITQMLYGERDMASYVAGRPLAHPPGTYLQYSSGSTNLLCAVLAGRAGIHADLPRRYLLGPLGLSSAIWEPDAIGTPVCSSYLWATPRDWAALGQFALQDGVWNGQRLLPEGWLAQTTTAQKVTTSEERGYAAGWWTNTDMDGAVIDPRLPADAYDMDGHDGQRVYVVPSKKLVVVRLGFSPSVEDKDLRVSDLVAALTAS